MKTTDGESGSGLENLYTGEKLLDWKFTPISAQAYLGAMGIVTALRRGADVVICGRVSDAPLRSRSIWVRADRQSSEQGLVFEVLSMPTSWERILAGNFNPCDTVQTVSLQCGSTLARRCGRQLLDARSGL